MGNFFGASVFLFALLVTFGMGSKKPVMKFPKIKQAESSGIVLVKLNITASPAQVKRVTIIKDAVQKIVNSKKFEDRILGAMWKGKLQFQGTSLSNKEVLDVIKKHDWALDIGIERARCSTLGWTTPNVTRFWFNSCGFDNRTDAGLAGTICHEYQHKLGFTHDKNRTPWREFSEPYAVGTICAELYNEFI